MTDTITDAAPAQEAAQAPARTESAGGGLAGLKLAQLKALASQLGISGSSRMRKSDLVEAISSHQRGGAVADREQAAKKDQAAAQQQSEEKKQAKKESSASQDSKKKPAAEAEESAAAQDSGAEQESSPKNEDSRPRGSRGRGRNRGKDGQSGSDQQNDSQSQDNQSQGGKEQDRQKSGDNQDRQREKQNQRNSSEREGSKNKDSEDQKSQQQNEKSQNEGSRGREDREDRGPRDDRDDRRNRRRNRNDRNRRGRNRGPEHDDTEVTDEDQLIPIAGILDVLDNYAFVRTSGYLPGQNDVYVALAQVKKFNLRKGDVVTGFIKAPRDDQKPNKRQKFNALVRVEKVNGRPAEQNAQRIEFNKLVPLYPQERLRLEGGDPKAVGPRVIDLISPIGKGQRGLIVSPPKAGKTIILQSVANAIKQNNPEVHLMMVLVDERPEEVTDMQRTVDGEVIASTFDRPAEDHTTAAELAIERAKRLVELGKDVVVLLDSMTRLGRAYNQAAPASGRILSGGVDASALYPPKRFFGAARNIEDGGSLTILATALVETGSKMDEVIFEEFKGTGNMELRLSRQLADRRIFPAVNVNESSTRREENLLSAEEVKIMWKLRRVLSGLDQQQGLELLMSKLKETQSNAEFLMLINKTTLGENGK